MPNSPYAIKLKSFEYIIRALFSSFSFSFDWYLYKSGLNLYQNPYSSSLVLLYWQVSSSLSISLLSTTHL